MKKLLTILMSSSLLLSSTSSVFACNYIDTVQNSIENTIKSIINNTRAAFYAPILGKHESLDSDYSRNLIMSSATNKIIPELQSTDKYSQSLDSYINKTDLNEFYANLNIQDPDFIGIPIASNPELENISSLFNTIYGIIGSNFSIDLSKMLTTLISKAVSNDEAVKTLNNTLSGFPTMETGKIISFPDLSNLENLVETNAELNWFALVSLYNFIAKSTGQEEIIWTEFKKLSNVQGGLLAKDSKQKRYNKLLSSLFEKIFKKEVTFTLNLNDLAQFLTNFLFSISKYIEAFDGFYVEEEHIIDSNHTFSNYLTNLEVINQVRSLKYTYIENDQNIGHALDLFTELFGIKLASQKPQSNLPTPRSENSKFNMFRSLKILFQNDEDDGLGTFKDKVFGGKETIWKDPLYNVNGLSPFLNGIFGGLMSKIVPSNISGIISLLGLGTSNIGAIISNLLSGILANNDISWFFSTLKDGLGDILDLLGAVGPILGLDQATIDSIIALISNAGQIAPYFKNSLEHILYGTGLKNIVNLLSVIGIKLPESFTKLDNLSQLWDTTLYGEVSIKDTFNTLLSDPSGIVQFINNVPGLLNKISQSTIRQGFLEGKYVLTNASNQNANDRMWATKAAGLEGGPAEDEIVTDIALALNIMTQQQWKVWMTDENGETISMSTEEFANYALGTYNNSFREGTLYYELGKLYTGYSQKFVSSLFSYIKILLESIQKDIDNEIKNQFIEYIKPQWWSAKLVSYTNLENSTEDSTLIYNINYSKDQVNVTYQVELKLPKIENNITSKYKIISFKQI